MRVGEQRQQETEGMRYISNELGFSFVRQRLLITMRFIRYPGGKSRLLYFLSDYLPPAKRIRGIYIEPFVGGGSVFFHVNPKNAILSDLNPELITLYRGIRNFPHKVWEYFRDFPAGKESYYRIREKDMSDRKSYYKAARTLFLNRTCFKGMWRHNSDGMFNVGYGGEERRWVIDHQNIIELSFRLRSATIQNEDFETVINKANGGDFIFMDPPYKPGKKDLDESHYSIARFPFAEQIRLASTLKAIPKSKRVRWAMTNSSHKDIKKLYEGFVIRKIPVGTSDRPGIQTSKSGEVLITNY